MKYKNLWGKKVAYGVLFPQSSALFKGQQLKRSFPNSLVRFAVVEVWLAIVHVSAKTVKLYTATKATLDAG